MSFMEQAAAKLATKYGVVEEGKYEGCQIAMGNPPEEKVTTAYSFSQIIFVDDKEEKGRYNIIDLRMGVIGQTPDGMKMVIFFNDDEKCIFTLALKKKEKESFLASLLKAFIGPKRTPEQEHEAIYHNMIIFFRQTFAVMLGDSVNTFEAYFKENGVLDDLTASLIGIYKEKMAKTAEK